MTALVSKALGLVGLVLVAAAASAGLAAQVDVAARLEGRVAPEVARAVQDIARGAAARGLPVERLIEKAIEGGAKQAPADQVIAAVRALAARLDQAAGALREGGIESPGADVVEGGAYALNAGLSARQLRDLARVSHPPYDATLTLRVATTLAARGVPPKQTLGLMRDMIKAGRAPRDLLALPSQVEMGMARGATPAQAAEGLARAAARAPTARPPREHPGQLLPHRP